MITYTNEDCMELMARYPDKHFDLAIVDPPYGIGADCMTLGNGKNKIFRGNSKWDSNTPNDNYFTELYRISKNQIIWGANHYPQFLSKSAGWIFWDKGTGANDFSDGELAYTSFDKALRKIFVSWVGANAKDYGERMHPTQKPVKLYKWLLTNYAKQGDLILDTHVGSASSLIACHDLGFDAVGCELDADYYAESKKRLEWHMKQPKLFEIEQEQPKQIDLLEE